MTIVEQISAIVQNLPQEKAREVLNFAELIHSQNMNSIQLTTSFDTAIPWDKLVYSLAGMWEQDFPTVEEIRSELGKEILRESF